MLGALIPSMHKCWFMGSFYAWCWLPTSK